MRQWFFGILFGITAVFGAALILVTVFFFLWLLVGMVGAVVSIL